MKRKYLSLLSLFVLPLSLATNIDSIKTNAYVKANLDNAYTTENVASGKACWFTYADGSMVPSNKVSDLHTSEAFDSYALTDGDCLPGLNHKIAAVFDAQGNWANAFACIDLEKEYTITSFDLKFWNDHSYGQIVIQVASDSSFTNPITVFNNDTANIMGQGYGSDISYKDEPEVMQNISIYPVVGRYIRVSGKSANDGRTFFSEIGVNAVSSGLAPVATSLGIEKQNSDAILELKSNNKIYYTLDGTYPTAASIEYTTPIELKTIAKPKALVRAVAIDDNNNVSIVSNFKYEVIMQSENVAYGKQLVIPSNKMNGNLLPTWQGNPSQTSATDGAEDPFNTLGFEGPDWATLDFGDVYSINKVAVKFWHDWEFGAIIQLSTTADFSSGNYTVFSNYGKGSGVWDSYENIPMTEDVWYVGFKSFEFDAVDARYMRVLSITVRNASRWSCFEELQAWTAVDDGSQKAKNVTQGKQLTIPSNLLVNGNLPVFQGSPTNANPTDGIFDPFNANGVKNPCWATIDFGKIYEVDKVVVQLWHDWSFGAIIQLSTTADFSSGNYTVFSNYGKGSGIWDNVDNIPMTEDAWFVQARTFEFEAVNARYIRVYSVSVVNTDRWSCWEEIQVYSKAIPAQETYYPTIIRPIVKADEIENIDVPYATTKEDIISVLPSNITVYDDTNYKEVITGTWECNDYDSKTSTEYEFIFTPSSNSFVDSFNIMKSIVNVLAKPNKEELQTLVERYEGLDSTKYVSQSWTKLATTYIDCKAIYDKEAVTQNEVDGAVIKLNKAIKDLVLKGDKTNLNTLISESDLLVKANYTTASYANFEGKLNAAKQIQVEEEASQAVVNLALNDLEEAKNNLELLGNKTELTNRYNELKDTTNIYTNASYKNFKEQLEDARLVLLIEEASQNALDRALDELNNAYTNLVIKADFSSLENALAKVDRLVFSEYTSTSVDSLLLAYENGKDVLANDESTSDVINEAITNINASIDALVKLGNKNELVFKVLGLDYDSTKYTASSYNNLIEAKDNANNVLNNKDAIQADIDSAIEKLDEAIASLKEKANLTKLKALVEECKTIKEEDYTISTYAILEEALVYANSIKNSNDASNEDANEAIRMIEAARNNLQLLNQETSKGCKSEASSMLSLMVIALAILKRKNK